jgi:hypothetical protein
VFAAFQQGLDQLGFAHSSHDMSADVAVIWSVLWSGRMQQNHAVWQTFCNSGRSVIVLEVGGIRRGTTWKVGLNGINRGSYHSSRSNDSIRHSSLELKLKPWRTDGEFILLCGQHDKSLQWKNMPSMSNWVIQTVDKIRQYTNRPIIFRPHPRCKLDHIEQSLKNVYRQEPVMLANTYDSYDLKFDNIWATVSWSSNPGPQSIIEGVPAFVGPNSLAYDVANTDFKNIENGEYTFVS